MDPIENLRQQRKYMKAKEPYEAEVELGVGESFLIPESAENVQVTVFERDGGIVTRIAWDDTESPKEGNDPKGS